VLPSAVPDASTIPLCVWLSTDVDTQHFLDPSDMLLIKRG
jgi:hypothetical protein